MKILIDVLNFHLYFTDVGAVPDSSGALRKLDRPAASQSSAGGSNATSSLSGNALPKPPMFSKFR